MLLLARAMADGLSLARMTNWDASMGVVLKDHTDLLSRIFKQWQMNHLCSDDRFVRVWDAPTGKVLNVVEDHISLVHSVTFSSDDRQIVSGLGVRLVWVWDASTGEVLNVPEGCIAMESMDKLCM